MSMTVTATQGGATSGGMAVQVRVLTGTMPVSEQTGAVVGVQSSTPNLDITPTGTGSYLFSAVLSTNAVAPTAESGETTLNTIGSAGLYFSFYQETGVASGAQTLMGSSTGTGIAISNVEILNNGLGISTWNEQPGEGTGSLIATTASFSPPPGALLVAMVASNGGAGTTTMTITDTFGLTWTCLQQENGGSHGYVGIWIAQLPDPLPNVSYVWDVMNRGNTTSTQTVSYVPASLKSLLLCCGSLYNATGTVQPINSISDNAGNTWHYATTTSQLPPNAGQVISGQYYSTFIGWTWQDKGAANTFNVNFGGSAYVHMDISEWSAVGSITNAASIAGTTTSTSLVGPTVPVTYGSIAVAITNSINGALTTATATGSDGTPAGTISGESVKNFIVLSGNPTTNPLLQRNNPYNFTFTNFGSGMDYVTSIIVLNQRGAPTGSFFRLPTSPGSP